ncbi:Ig-like domain-containing protein [Candidatus Palauibacter sp.]|uniref:Ig-like domain-containing protein n=1 Tax=Candidatus Palauibacter sp. TaxID=3101350 RepID=UPI003B52B2AA
MGHLPVPPRRLAIRAAVALAGTTWMAACGGGATDPAPPLPPPRPAAVAVSPATAELVSLGATVQFDARVTDQNGRALTGLSLTWSSSDAAVATVDASGLATAAANGTAAVTVAAGAATGSSTTPASPGRRGTGPRIGGTGFPTAPEGGDERQAHRGTRRDGLLARRDPVLR